jgi:hypothetical protein
MPTILQSTITCPNCGSVKTETMPTNACQFFYNCVGCGVRLKPKAGDCCVFCSYGNVPCPPVQQAGDCYERCQGNAEITTGAMKLGWLNLPVRTEVYRQVMPIILTILALLATGGAFCIFCL